MSISLPEFEIEVEVTEVRAATVAVRARSRESAERMAVHMAERGQVPECMTDIVERRVKLLED